jgi:hypothetical protein
VQPRRRFGLEGIVSHDRFEVQPLAQFADFFRGGVVRKKADLGTGPRGREPHQNSDPVSWAAGIIMTASLVFIHSR